MDIYKNILARLREQRVENFLKAVDQGQSVSDAAKRYGFPRRTAYRILVRTTRMASRRLSRFDYFEALAKAVQLRRDNPRLSARTIREMLIAEGMARIPSERTLRAYLKKSARRQEDESYALAQTRKARALYLCGDKKSRDIAGELLYQAKRVAPRWFQEQAPGVFGLSKRQIYRLINRANASPNCWMS